LKTADRDTWDKVFNFYVKEIDHTIFECLAYIENHEIRINYLEIKLPNTLAIFQQPPYHLSKSIEQAEALIANIFLSTLAKNTKYILQDILNIFRKNTYNYRYNDIIF